jgi:hypothetical protein
VAFYLHDVDEDLSHPAQQIETWIPEIERGCAGGVLLGEGRDQ